MNHPWSVTVSNWDNDSGPEVEVFDTEIEAANFAGKVRRAGKEAGADLTVTVRQSTSGLAVFDAIMSEALGI